MKTHKLEHMLKASLVLVHFKLKHFPIKQKKSSNIAGNTFSAVATQVKILERAAERKPSRYKSLMLKGPTVLPHTPSKKKTQAWSSDVTELHTGNVASFSPSQSRLIILNLADAPKSQIENAGSSNRDTGTPLPITSLKMEGKKKGSR